MIQINKGIEPEVEIFDPSGQSIGKTSNDAEFADLRAQIAEQGAEGLYDGQEKALARIFSVQIKKAKESKKQ